MAIDTENKRRAVQSYWLGVLPVADTTIGLQDRGIVQGLYLGDCIPPESGGEGGIYRSGGFIYNIGRMMNRGI